ncbi:hypothetical protein [uncultured Campylobacter sp.]|uniref:hypothetical protein n=1 Tax=uncultured Campylobacter sp. TaxID=218934 RepID=UPI00260DCCAA|nr:hypothetical protein [uncultured Campylobacter sp.]
MLNALRPPSLRVLADTGGIGASKFSRTGQRFTDLATAVFWRRRITGRPRTYLMAFYSPRYSSRLSRGSPR